MEGWSIAFESMAGWTGIGRVSWVFSRKAFIWGGKRGCVIPPPEVVVGFCSGDLDAAPPEALFSLFAGILNKFLKEKNYEREGTNCKIKTQRAKEEGTHRREWLFGLK